MRFLVCKRQRGEGCDYTIGCGMRYSFIEAASLEDAIEKTVWPDGREEYSACDPDREMCLKEILIAPAESVFSVDVDSKIAEVRDIKRREKAMLQEQAERKEFERLKQKFGS